MISKGKREGEREGRKRRKAGRPSIDIDRRILEAAVRLHGEGHPWPRLRERLELVSKRYGGPCPLSTEQARRLVRKAAGILGITLKTRRAGRRYDYYRQIEEPGGAY